MDNSALQIAEERFIALVTAIIETGLGPGALFAAVFQNGEEVKVAALPIAYIMFGAETVSETSSKQMMTLPVILGVEFEVTNGVKPNKRAAQILGELKKNLLSTTNRRLPGSNPTAAAIDVRYTGGGSDVYMVDEEESPGLWGFLTTWEIDYRHLTADPATVA